MFESVGKIQNTIKLTKDDEVLYINDNFEILIVDDVKLEVEDKITFIQVIEALEKIQNKEKPKTFWELWKDDNPGKTLNDLLYEFKSNTETTQTGISQEVVDKINSLKNYDDSNLVQILNEIKEMVLSQKDYTNSLNQIKALLERSTTNVGNSSDSSSTEIKELLNTVISKLNSLDVNVDLSSVEDKLDELEGHLYFELEEIKKVSPSSTNIDLSSSTDKLNSLNNYDDTEIKEKLEVIKNKIDNINTSSPTHTSPSDEAEALTLLYNLKKDKPTITIGERITKQDTLISTTLNEYNLFNIEKKYFANTEENLIGVENIGQFKLDYLYYDVIKLDENHFRMSFSGYSSKGDTANLGDKRYLVIYEYMSRDKYFNTFIYDLVGKKHVTTNDVSISSNPLEYDNRGNTTLNEIKMSKRYQNTRVMFGITCDNLEEVRGAIKEFLLAHINEYNINKVNDIVKGINIVL